MAIVGDVAYILPPMVDIPHAVWWLGMAAIGTSMSIAGVWQGPQARRRIWVAIAVGQVLYFTGDVLWVIFENYLHIAPYPSVADAVYLLRYVAIAIGLVWLVRGRTNGRDRAAFLDAAIISTAAAVAIGVFLVIPAAESGGTTLLSRLVAAAYPVGDVLLLAVLVRLATTTAARSVAFTTLVSGLAVVLACDIVYTYYVTAGISLPTWLDACYRGSYALIGFAAMYPSSSGLARPGPDTGKTLSAWRLTTLTGAVVVSPSLLITLRLTHQQAHEYLLGTGTIIGSVLLIVRLLELLRRAERQSVLLGVQARYDSLTGIANRRSWDYELARAVDVCAEQGMEFTVALIDVDNFKRFNDTHGHLMGDLVLKEAAAAWTHLLDSRGFLARYGGEEFAVIIPHTEARASEALLDRMRAVPRGLTCSIGATVMHSNEDVLDIVERADQALYYAKLQGRNRLAVRDADGSRLVHVDGINQLAEFLTPVYQPIVDITDGSVVGHEALSRFANRGPAEVFEEARMIGCAASLEARAISAALANRPSTGWLSINVGLGVLLDPLVTAALGAADLTDVVIEITEHAFNQSSSEVLSALTALRSRGARLAIDDLGTGFSNFQRLLLLQPEIIKLDQSLVRDAHLKPAHQALIRALVAYGKEMNLLLCAEGIESTAEARVLARLGVTLGQGFLFGRPTAAVPQQRRLADAVHLVNR